MADTELNKNGGGDATPPAPSGSTPPAPPEGGTPAPAAPAKTQEELRKEEHLANLDKAIREGTDELRRIRQATKDARKGTPPAPGEEDELPQIDETDPSVKAWDKRNESRIAPITQELEKEKEEVRSFALRKFLADKPALARNPEKVKELIGYYERIRTASERTTEGVLLDLDKAYAVVFHQEILDAARRGDVEGARTAGIAADIAVDHGATGYQTPKPRAKKTLTADDKKILASWGISEDEWQKDAEQFGSGE